MNVCRVCLSKDHDFYHPLFLVREDRTIAKTIMTCSGVKIKRKDGLPQMVCGTCSDEFYKFFNLRQRCLEADAFLRNNFGSDHGDASESQHEATVEFPGLEDYKIEVLDVDFDPHCDPANTLVPGGQNETIVNAVEADHKELKPSDNVDIVEPPRAPEASPVKSLRARRSQRTVVVGVARRRRRKVVNFDCDSPAKYICCSCPSEAFASSTDLELHRAEHHAKYRIADNVIRPFECDVCFQRFLTEKLLQLHKSRPYKKREHVCTSCGSAFLANSTLKKHEEICNGPSQRYACDECGKRFTQVGSLNNHMMLHNAEKTHSCPVCAKTFLKKFEVAIHMVTHTEEQPFPCDQCSARFKRKQALRNHLKHHSNPTPYKCDLCEEWFNNFSARKFHRQKVHDGIEPFRCDQCGASYGRKNRLEQHVKRMHAAAGV